LQKSSNTLSPIQARILLAMLRAKDHSLNSEEILKQTGIALSTWSAEQGKLGEMSLIQKQLVRVLTSASISKRMNYTLTESGVAVALNLQNISRILSENSQTPGIMPKSEQSGGESFDAAIRECIEIGLDGFGANLLALVKATLQSEQGVTWEQISQRPEQFTLACKSLFGEEASKKLETVILANISSRFAIGEPVSGFKNAISEARKSFTKGQRLLGGQKN
jgi:DNA-binding MarR family transcriptional regulator